METEKFENWLKENNWLFEEGIGYINSTTDEIKQEKEILILFEKSLIIVEQKIETINEKKNEQKIEIKKENEIREIPEKEALDILYKCKYKGTVDKYDLNPKQGTCMKKVILYSEPGKIYDQFCYKTSL